MATLPNPLHNLLTEQPNPASARIDKLSTLEMVQVINDEDRRVAESITPELPAIAAAIDGIVAAFNAGGRLFYIGAGTSGRLGVLCGIAASGRTPYVLGAIAEANRMGALTIGISCSPGSELALASKIAITPLPGPEVIAGSTRLKAGTATKLVLNMLTTGAFIRTGYVWGNLMVNVQPKNTKLLDRAQRIIASATGVSYDEAAELLRAADNNVRRAIESWER